MPRNGLASSLTSFAVRSKNVVVMRQKSAIKVFVERKRWRINVADRYARIGLAQSYRVSESVAKGLSHPDAIQTKQRGRFDATLDLHLRK